MCHVSIAFYKQASRLFFYCKNWSESNHRFFYQFSLHSPFLSFFRFIQMENHSWSAAVAEGLESLFGQNRSKVVSVWYEWKNEWMKRTVEKNGHVWANYVADKHVRSRVCVSKFVFFFSPRVCCIQGMGWKSIGTREESEKKACVGPSKIANNNYSIPRVHIL